MAIRTLPEKDFFGRKDELMALIQDSPRHNSSLFKKLARKAAENKRLYENMRHIYHDTTP